MGLEMEVETSEVVALEAVSIIEQLELPITNYA